MNSLGRQRSHLIAGLALAGVLVTALALLLVSPLWAQEGGTIQRAQGLLNSFLWMGMPTSLGEFANPVSPRILFAPNGTTHVIWESEGRLYHAWRSPLGTWNGPIPIFRGVAPSLAIDQTGQVHMVFAQDVVGNFEIYYTRFDGFGWTLPRNVSHTPGHSYSPYISIAPDGSLHVVWNERISGGDVIYHAVLDGATWVAFPIPSAWGKAPTLHIIDRVAHVLWQGPSITSIYDIYHVQGIAGTWQLPQNLSDTPAKESIGVRSVPDARGWIHAVWLEQGSRGYRVTYTFGNGTAWRWPETLSGEGAEDVTIGTSERGTYVHIGWGDASTWWTRWRALVSPYWSDPIPMAYADGRAVIFRFAPQNDSRLRALWRLETAGGAEMWYGEASTPVVQRHFFALLGRNAR